MYASVPLAEDEKLKAEAHAIMGCCGRASRAKEIDGELGADQSLDPDWEEPRDPNVARIQERLAVLRGAAARC